MTGKQPTQEQIREFWKWCGVIPIIDTRSKSGKPVVFRLDLNNLFKYAVPRYIEVTSLEHPTWDEKGIIHHLFKSWLREHRRIKIDFDLALFWALRQALKG